MEFEWDSRKAVSNLKKHGVDFADAATVLNDELAITIQGVEAEEERFITLGMNTLGRLPAVVYTWRGDRVRIVSAREATPKERRQYEG